MRVFFVLILTLYASRSVAETTYIVYDLAKGEEVSVSAELQESVLPKIDPVDSKPFMESGDYKIPDARLLELKEAKAKYADYAQPNPEDLEEDDDFVEFGIVGEDTRELVTSTLKFPASAIVQIKFKNVYGKNDLCTGSLISIDTVLTAGHCVRGLDAVNFSLEWHSEFDVYPGRNGPVEPFKFCGVDKIFVLSGWNGRDGNHDMAALRLDCIIGSETGNWGVRAAGPNDKNIELTVQGYPADKIPEGRQFISHDEVQQIDEYRIEHKADTVGGNSGSPVYSGDDHRIFAVHASMVKAANWTRENKSAMINRATRITEERLKIIKSWIEYEK